MKSKVAHANSIVMIVDDTPDNLALLSDTLTEVGYRVLVATDGLSALEQIACLKPDIILLDVMMPGIDGFETCNRLKSEPGTAHIPVVFMTALSDLDNLLRGFDEGAVDYITKPIRPPEVLARVDVQLTHARNLQRAENALNNSHFSALAIDLSGNITWLTPGSRCWLDSFSKTHALTGENKIGSLLPQPILEWVKRLKSVEKLDGESFESHRLGVDFIVTISQCQNTAEYLLVLEKHSGEWDLDSVRNSLGLTFREAEILMWISRGKTNKEVGLILNSSPRTINKHLEHVFEKLGVVTRAAAVSKVLKRT
ncbi:MAG: response regulator [Gammaproteobacteria bacterium]